MNKVNSNQKSKESKSGESKDNQTRNKSKSTDNKHKNAQADDGKLVETARKIETGAKVFGEKAADVAEKVTDQTTEITEIAFDKLKKGVQEAYDISSKTMNDMGKKTGKYIQKYEDTLDIKDLKRDRDKKMYELGTHIFNLSKSKSQKLPELIANDVSQKILNEVELLEKDIVKLGRRIKRKI